MISPFWSKVLLTFKNVPTMLTFLKGDVSCVMDPSYGPDSSTSFLFVVFILFLSLLVVLPINPELRVRVLTEFKLTLFGKCVSPAGLGVSLIECSTICDTKFDHVVRVITARSPHRKCMSFPFANNLVIRNLLYLL